MEQKGKKMLIIQRNFLVTVYIIGCNDWFVEHLLGISQLCRHVCVV